MSEPDYERDGRVVPGQIFRGIHWGMIESRDEFPEEVKEWAAFMLESDNLPRYIEASCHMILCRGGKACAGGIHDLEHARQAYHIIAQLTYEYGKEHPKDDVWIRKLHALYQMRRAMQDREVQLKKQKQAPEQKKKRQNRGYDVSSKNFSLPTHHGVPNKRNCQDGHEVAEETLYKGVAWWNASFTSTFYNGLEFPNPFLDEEVDDFEPPKPPNPGQEDLDEVSKAHEKEMTYE